MKRNFLFLLCFLTVQKSFSGSFFSALANYAYNWSDTEQLYREEETQNNSETSYAENSEKLELPSTSTSRTTSPVPEEFIFTESALKAEAMLTPLEEEEIKLKPVEAMYSKNPEETMYSELPPIKCTRVDDIILNIYQVVHWLEYRLNPRDNQEHTIDGMTQEELVFFTPSMNALVIKNYKHEDPTIQSFIEWWKQNRIKTFNTTVNGKPVPYPTHGTWRRYNGNFICYDDVLGLEGILHFHKRLDAGFEQSDTHQDPCPEEPPSHKRLAAGFEQSDTHQDLCPEEE